MRERTLRPFLQVLVVSFGVFLSVGLVHGQGATPASAPNAPPVRRAGDARGFTSQGLRGLHSRAHGISCVGRTARARERDSRRTRGSDLRCGPVARLRDRSGRGGWRISAEGPAGAAEIQFRPCVEVFETGGGGSDRRRRRLDARQGNAGLYLSKPEFAGPLARMDSEAKDAKVPSGSVVVVTGTNDEKFQGAVSNAVSQGAAGVIVPASANAKAHWDARGQKLPNLAPRLEGGKGKGGFGWR